MDDDQERCMGLAEPLLGEFHAAWHQAFKKFIDIPPEFTAEFDDTTAANVIRSYMLAEVVRRFGDRPGFTLIKLQRLSLLDHKGETLWRFKQVNATGRHQNYQTDQQRAYDDQEVIPGIPPEAVRLTSGYQPDASGTLIERVVVARPIGRGVAWASQVNIVDDVVSWSDMIPQRFDGTERIDFRKRRK